MPALPANAILLRMRGDIAEGRPRHFLIHNWAGRQRVLAQNTLYERLALAEKAGTEGLRDQGRGDSGKGQVFGGAVVLLAPQLE